MSADSVPSSGFDESTREKIRRLVGQGLGQRDVGALVGRNERSVRLALAQNGGFKVDPRSRSRLHLTLAEREEISRGLATGDSFRGIARRLGRSPSTIYREVQRNGGCSRYRATRADRAAWDRALRPKPSKLSRCPKLRDEVEELLKQRWSPQQISSHLKRRHPGNEQMNASHETIYKSLFVQSRGEFRKELTRYLRSKQTKRRPVGQGKPRWEIENMVMISERPAEVKDRAVPGHWEGDLLLGKAGRSAIVTLVERHTRYALLARVGNDKSTESVTKTIAAKIGTLPRELTKTLTWDQGREMTAHKQFTIDTGVQVYFCEPSSPWQRGSNENTNRLLRDYFPKGTDLSAHSQEELDAVASELNRRPRQTLDWDSPAERMAALLR